MFTFVSVARATPIRGTASPPTRGGGNSCRNTCAVSGDLYGNNNNTKQGNIQPLNTTPPHGDHGPGMGADSGWVGSGPYKVNRAERPPTLHKQQWDTPRCVFITTIFPPFWHQTFCLNSQMLIVFSKHQFIYSFIQNVSMKLCFL